MINLKVSVNGYDKYEKEISAREAVNSLLKYIFDKQEKLDTFIRLVSVSESETKYYIVFKDDIELTKSVFTVTEDKEGN